MPIIINAITNRTTFFFFSSIKTTLRHSSEQHFNLYPAEFSFSVRMKEKKCYSLFLSIEATSQKTKPYMTRPKNCLRHIWKSIKTMITDVTPIFRESFYSSSLFCVCAATKPKKLLDRVDLDWFYNFCSQVVIKMLLRKKVARPRRITASLCFKEGGILSVWVP